MILQCSKVFYSKDSSGSMREDLQSSYSFGIIQNVGGPEFSEEMKKKKKKISFSLKKDFIFRLHAYTIIIKHSFPIMVPHTTS